MDRTSPAAGTSLRRALLGTFRTWPSRDASTHSMTAILADIPDPLIFFLGALLGSLVSGFAGFGYAAVAATFVTGRVDPVEAVALMMLCSVVVQSAGLVHLRATIRWREAVPVAVAGAFGLVIALPLLVRLDTRTFTTAFGAFVVLYAALALLRPAREDRTDIASPGLSERLVVGALSGAIGAITAMPGGALSVWGHWRRMGLVDRAQLRGLVQPFILALQVVGLILLTASGTLDPLVLGFAMLASAPGLVAGTAFGFWLYHRCDPVVFARKVMWVILISGIGLLAS